MLTIVSRACDSLETFAFDVSLFADYPVGDGSCEACPRNRTGWDQYKGLLSILAAVLGLVLVLYALLLLLVHYVGGTLSATAGHAGQLLAWTITTLQGVAQVAAVTSSSLPSLLQALFNSVSF